MQIEQLAEQGNWAAKLTAKALDRLDFYLSASQIGITVASLALGRTMHDWVEPMVESAFLRLGIRDPHRDFRHLDPHGDDRGPLTGDLSAHGAGRASPQEPGDPAHRGYWCF